MLFHYVSTSLRQILKYRGHTFVCTISLSMSLAGMFLIFLYVFNELSFDKYHTNSRRIYRIITEMTFNGIRIKEPITPGPLAPTMEASLPEIKIATRVSPMWIGSVGYNNQDHDISGHFAEPSLFDVLSIPIVSGSLERFTEPSTALLTTRAAVRIFNQQDPIGQVISIPGYGFVEVVGILDEMPPNSHLTFNLLVSFNTLSSKLIGWGAYQFWTYTLVHDNTNPRSIENKLLVLANIHSSHADELQEINLSYSMQPLASVYFSDEYAPRKGNITNVYVFLSIAVVILLMACSNYLCLTTAKIGNRMREIGIHKTFGAGQKEILSIFLTESLIVSVLALPICLVILTVLTPLLSFLTDSLSVYSISNLSAILLFFGAITVFVCLGGLFPTWVLSTTRTTKLLLGLINRNIAIKRLQRGLLLFQFVVSITLIVVSLFIYKQMSFIQNKDLGFSKSDLLTVGIAPGQSWSVLKSEFSSLHNVLGTSASIGVPGKMPNVEVPVQVNGLESIVPARLISVDQDFITTLGLQILKGRNFNSDFTIDSVSSCIVNESAVRQFGLITPINSTISVGHENLKIVGVVKDFHYESMHNRIAPLLMRIDPTQFRVVSIKVKSNSLDRVLPHVRNQWLMLAPGYSFSYSVLEDDMKSLYRKENNTGHIFHFFSFSAILLSCLGVSGLSSFLVRQFSKEIGLRRIMGASISNLTTVLSKDLFILIGLATCIAFPLAYYLTQSWLNEFVYRIHIDPNPFFLGGVIVGLVTFCIVRTEVSRSLIKCVLSTRTT